VLLQDNAGHLLEASLNVKSPPTIKMARDIALHAVNREFSPVDNRSGRRSYSRTS